MDDIDTTVTTISMSVGQVAISIETGVGLTPELVEDFLIRARRQCVACILELGLVGDAPEVTP